MIIERAFVALPELLLGNFYAVQDYEAGIVGVLSMAILQELNGRNVAHPIQHLQAERRYNPASPRRADLYVNLRRLMVANRRLGNYGWQHHNWVEAKFYRNKSPVQRHAMNKTTYQGQLQEQLARTCPSPDWHKRQAEMDERSKQWFAAAFHRKRQWLMQPWRIDLHLRSQCSSCKNNRPSKGGITAAYRRLTCRIKYPDGFCRSHRLPALVDRHTMTPIHKRAETVGAHDDRASE